MSLAVDISYWQGFLSQAVFAAWKGAGVTDVILKAGGAESGRFVKDSRHDANAAAARAAGLRIHHYFFNGNLDPAASADQLVAFANAQPGDGFWFDIENTTGVTHWNPSQALAALQRLKSAHGITAGVYMSSSVTKAQNWQPVVDFGAPLWVAQYGTNNGSPQGAPSIAYWKSFAFWQYTSNGRLPGYSGRLDLNQIGGTAVSGAPAGGAAGGRVTVISQPGVTLTMVQERLEAAGENLGPAGVDGRDGTYTRNALAHFQETHGLVVDLNVGTKTWAALSGEVSPASRGLTPPPFPLPAGSYFGPEGGPARSVSGYHGHSDGLRIWQQRMKDRGWNIIVDGLYGPKGAKTPTGNTASVAHAFQVEKGLKVDDLIGVETWNAAWTEPVT